MASDHEHIEFSMGQIEKAFNSRVLRGTIESVDHENNTADVEIDSQSYADVPIFYHCEGADNVDDGHLAFKEDDEVLILEENSEGQGPKDKYVIGFQDQLRPCGQYVEIKCGYGCIIWDAVTGALAQIPKHDGTGDIEWPAYIFDDGLTDWRAQHEEKDNERVYWPTELDENVPPLNPPTGYQNCGYGYGEKDDYETVESAFSDCHGSTLTNWVLKSGSGDLASIICPWSGSGSYSSYMYGYDLGLFSWLNYYATGLNKSLELAVAVNLGGGKACFRCEQEIDNDVSFSCDNDGNVVGNSGSTTHEYYKYMTPLGQLGPIFETLYECSWEWLEDIWPRPDGWYTKIDQEWDQFRYFTDGTFWGNVSCEYSSNVIYQCFAMQTVSAERKPVGSPVVFGNRSTHVVASCSFHLDTAGVDPRGAVNNTTLASAIEDLIEYYCTRESVPDNETIRWDAGAGKFLGELQTVFY